MYMLIGGAEDENLTIVGVFTTPAKLASALINALYDEDKGMRYLEYKAVSIDKIKDQMPRTLYVLPGVDLTAISQSYLNSDRSAEDESSFKNEMNSLLSGGGTKTVTESMLRSMIRQEVKKLNK